MTLAGVLLHYYVPHLIRPSRDLFSVIAHQSRKDYREAVDILRLTLQLAEDRDLHPPAEQNPLLNEEQRLAIYLLSKASDDPEVA